MTDDDLHASIEQVRTRMMERETTVRALMLESGRFERLHGQADAALTIYRATRTRHPDLFGTLVGVKDIFHVDGFPTTAGSRLPPEELEGPQSEAVTRLLGQGVLVLGKTVSTEFAFFAPGPTRNPHNPLHTPGGSSSGSAAAVASGYCPLALGTQTLGSIVRPAAYCGVVGFKPTYGRISAEGVIPLAPYVDHIGFFTTDVESAAMAAAALMDDYAPAAPSRKPVLGIPEGPYLAKAFEEGLAHFRETCDRLSAHYDLRPVPAMLDFEDINTRHRRLVAAEAAQVHADWFPRFENLYAPQTVDLIRRGQAVSESQLQSDRDGCDRLRDELARLMDENGIDLWISPPAQGAAPKGLAATGDPIMNLPWNHARVPVLGIPAGRNENGLPMGLQIAGRWDGDAELLAWGTELQKALAS
jgi:Asp-tRNA(Asn)/Glu-tRNA(Gln) amidotransferase A subunit family amidase